jgi:CheY-like chemotaxis protein
MTTAMLERVQELQISVVDDQTEAARDIQDLLATRNIRATVVTPLPQHSIEDLARLLTSPTPTAALVDHRLSERSGLQFTGARLAAMLNRQGTPAVLFSSRTEKHSYEVKVELVDIPAYLDRNDIHDADRIAVALDAARSEVVDKIPIERRKTYPTLIRVVNVVPNPLGIMVRILVPAWHRDDDVLVPLSWLEERQPDDLRSLISQRYMAMVNICTEDAREIFVDQARRIPTSEAALP